MKSIAKWTATMGIAASLVGVVGIAPSFADNWRNDNADIRRDEQRLRDLQYRRDREARRHDWRDVRSLDIQIADIRLHIEQDHRDVRGDYRDNRYDRDRYNNDRYNNDRRHDNRDNWRHGEGR